MKIEFESLKSSHQTLLDDFEELEQVKDDFKARENEMRIKVWKNVEEIDKLKGELLEKKGNELPTEKKPSGTPGRQMHQNRKTKGNNKRRWNKSFIGNKQKKDNWN